MEKNEWESKLLVVPKWNQKSCINDTHWDSSKNSRVISTKLRESSGTGNNTERLLTQNRWTSIPSSDIDTMSPSYRLNIHL